MFKTELIDFFNLLPVKIAAQREGFIESLHRQYCGFAEAGINDILRKADIAVELPIGSGENDLARFNKQDVRTFDGILKREVERA